MTTEAKETNALISVLGALWLSAGAGVASTQMINERRDVIMTGVLDGTRLSMFHRNTILHDDWLPMVIGMTLMNLVFTAFFLMVPLVLKLNRNYKILCFTCATIPVLGLVSWAAGGIVEYDMMRSLLADEAGATARSAG